MAEWAGDGKRGAVRARELLFASGRRVALFASLWWVLVEGDVYVWPLALVFVALATAASLKVLPPPQWRLRPLATLHFLSFFLKEMFLGGIDVGRRAFDPKLPISPDFLRYQVSVEGEAQLLLLTWTAGLLPGTVSVRIGVDSGSTPVERSSEQSNEQSNDQSKMGSSARTLDLHLLDSRLPVTRTLRQLEERIAAMFTAR